MKRIWLAWLLLFGAWSKADIGVIFPGDKSEPDPAILALDELAIRVQIVNGHAKVSIRQVFSNKTANVMEGQYNFALPGRASISDFAVWDDVTRIPGVILERRRAEELYEEIRAQAIDPGLLQQGEQTSESTRTSSVFSARVVPIPAWGNKRLEIEYQERLPIDRLQTYFAIPLRPDLYRVQRAGRLTIDFDVRSNHGIQNFQTPGKLYPVKLSAKTDSHVAGRFEGQNVSLAEDFLIQFGTGSGAADKLEVTAYRAAETEPGFFEASAVFGIAPGSAAGAGGGAPKTVLVLFDSSLSMQWEKLEHSYRALEAVLRSLGPQDKFNLLVYNSEVFPASPAPVAATPEEVEKALAFLKAQRLRGMTNLQAALDAGLAQSGPETYLVLLGDGSATRGIVTNGKLDAWFGGKWREKTEANRPRVYAFGLGDDANAGLLRMLARYQGVFEWVRSTEPIDFKLKSFVSKIGRRPVAGLDLTTLTQSAVQHVYSLEEAVFPGSTAAWVGQYTRPGQSSFVANGVKDGAAVALRANVSLPARNTEFDYLPRTWARARVDALLEKIDRDGEDRASIDEIIKLSRKYKFVTPYTSFLAAPRSLLRPRVIRPGDPVIRIKTDPSIASVVAMFPFGLTKRLRYLAEEETWQTRFLAPTDMPDGTHRVTLLLRDKQGAVYRESKTFVIVSKPPVVRVKLDRASFKAGEPVKLRVTASESTRTIVARLQGAAPVHLRWNQDMKVNTGDLLIPAHFPPGKHRLVVVAEDFAHNISTEEVALEVLQ